MKTKGQNNKINALDSNNNFQKNENNGLSASPHKTLSSRFSEVQCCQTRDDHMSPRNRFSSFYKEPGESHETAKKVPLNSEQHMNATLKMPRESESLNKCAKPKKKYSDSSSAESKMLKQILDLIIDEDCATNRHKKVSHKQGLKCLTKDDLKEENIDLLIYKLENCFNKSVVHKLQNVLDLLKQIKNSRTMAYSHRCSPEKYFDDDSIEASDHDPAYDYMLSNKCQQKHDFSKPDHEQSFKKHKKLMERDSCEIGVNVSDSLSTEDEHASLEVKGSFTSETSNKGKLKNGCGDGKKCSVAVQCSQDIKYATMSTNTFKERSFLREEDSDDVSSTGSWILCKRLLNSASNISIITSRQQLISATEGKTQFNWERMSNFYEERDQKKTFSSESAANRIQHYEFYDPSAGFNEISKIGNYRRGDLKQGMQKVDLKKSESCIKFLKVCHACQARTQNPESKLKKNRVKVNIAKRGIKSNNHRWCEEERNKKVLNDPFDFKLTGKYKDRKYCKNKRTCKQKVNEYKRQSSTYSTGCEYFSTKAKPNTVESKCGGSSVVNFGSDGSDPDLKENKIETKSTNVSSSNFNETKNNVNYCRAKLFSSNCNSNYVDQDDGEKPEKVMEYFMFPEKEENPENEAELEEDEQGMNEESSLKSPSSETSPKSPSSETSPKSPSSENSPKSPSEARFSKTDSKTDEFMASSSNEKLLVKIKKSLRSSISDFIKRKASRSKSSASLKSGHDEIQLHKPIDSMKTGKAKKIIDFLEKELDIDHNDTFVLVFTNRDDSKVKAKKISGSRNSIKVLTLNKTEEKGDARGKSSFNGLNRRTISFDTKTTTIGLTADEMYERKAFEEDVVKMKSKDFRSNEHTKSEPAKDAEEPWGIGEMSRYRPLDSCQSKIKEQPEISFWQKSKHRGGMKCQIDISEFALKVDQVQKSNQPKEEKKCRAQEQQTEAPTNTQEKLACIGQNQCGDGCDGCVLQKKPQDNNYVINLEPSRSKELCFDLYCPFVPHVFYEERRC